MITEYYFYKQNNVSKQLDSSLGNTVVMSINSQYTILDSPLGNTVVICINIQYTILDGPLGNTVVCC